jgi:hypothetical protein
MVNASNVLITFLFVKYQLVFKALIYLTLNFQSSSFMKQFNDLKTINTNHSTSVTFKHEYFQVETISTITIGQNIDLYNGLDSGCGFKWEYLINS